MNDNSIWYETKNLTKHIAQEASYKYKGLEGMYKDVGGKIKKLTTIISAFGVVLSVVLGFVVANFVESMVYYIDDIYVFAIGAAVAILGALISWISGFMLYGFGEIVDNTERINTKLLYIKEKLEDEE